MDGTRFDALAKGLASARSRRGVVKGLGAALLGAAGLARFGGAEAKPACRDAGHPCEGNQTCCGDLVCIASGPGAAKRCTAAAACAATGDFCTAGDQCCSGVCIGSNCLAGKVEDGGDCFADSDCLSGACCVHVCVPVDYYTTPINCGGCGNVCPGFGKANTNVTCSDGQCQMSCQGENYDLNGSPANGCEAADSPQGNHTRSTATDLGTKTCSDGGSATNVSGVILSDGRVHESPAIVGFNAATGSAPDYYVIHASGGLTCVNTVGGTFSITSGTPSCYTLTVSSDKGTIQRQGSGAIPALDYSDGTDVVFEVAKTCGTSVTEAANYTLSFHL